VKASAQFQGEGASFGVNTTNSTPVEQRRQEGRRNQSFCIHCKRNGHTVEKCYKIHAYPTSNRQGGRSKNYKSTNNSWTDVEKAEEPATIPSLPGLSHYQSRQLTQFLSNLTVGAGSKQEGEEANASAAYMAGISQVLRFIHCFCALGNDARIFDSGASKHMCSEQTALHDPCQLQHPILMNLPNGSQVRVTKHGKLRISMDLVLNHVLHVPNFKFDCLHQKTL